MPVKILVFFKRLNLIQRGSRDAQPIACRTRGASLLLKFPPYYRPLDDLFEVVPELLPAHDVQEEVNAVVEEGHIDTERP